jgi:DNA-binding response OmpR family regulator
MNDSTPSPARAQPLQATPPAHMPLVLIIEDEEPIRRFLRATLEANHYRVKEAGTAREGALLAVTTYPDVILLDLGLPDGDGLNVTRSIRKEARTPIVVLSARGLESDKVAALDAGADDYLTKPFPMSEALARIHALLRRKYDKKDPVLHIADLELDPIRRTVSRAGEPVPLTALEYRLLEYLAFRCGELVSRTEIWEHVFEDTTGGNSNVADVYIGYLRKKLNTGDLPNLIHTRRGQGFVLESA